MSLESPLRQWMPLPGNVWRSADKSGKSYYQRAIEVLEQSVEFAVISKRLPVWSEDFVKEALYFAITRQAERTGRIASIENPPVNDDRWNAMMVGEAEPDELVSLWKDLDERRNKIGIEVARLTHVGVWDTENLITSPVLKSVVNDSSLGTQLIDGQPFFKLVKSDSRDRGEIIERKQLITTHGGNPFDQKEKLWMMRRDIMLVDFEGIKQTIENDNGRMSSEAKQAAALRSKIAHTRKHDRVKRVSEMNDVVEPILAQPIDFRPRYIRPLLTTMYLRDPA